MQTRASRSSFAGHETHSHRRPSVPRHALAGGCRRHGLPGRARPVRDDEDLEAQRLLGDEARRVERPRPPPHRGHAARARHAARADRSRSGPRQSPPDRDVGRVLRARRRADAARGRRLRQRRVLGRPARAQRLRAHGDRDRAGDGGPADPRRGAASRVAAAIPAWLTGARLRHERGGLLERVRQRLQERGGARAVDGAVIA